MIVLNQRAVLRALDMPACIRVMRDTMRDVADGRAVQPLRQYVHLHGSMGRLGMMPAGLSERGVVGIKVITVVDGNLGSDFDSHQGAVLLFEVQHGRLIATVDATSITAIRTAAVSAVATDVLARSDASVLAILGSGTEAMSHLDAMIEVRPIRRVRIWSRNTARARAFIERARLHHVLEFEVAPTPEAAIVGADIVCTATAARTPIVDGRWLSPGAHVNAVGSSVATRRELDSAAVARATLIVDSRESALHEAGDFLLARFDGAVTDAHIVAELGEVLAGRHPGRRSAEEITLFKSVGLGVEDVAAAWYVYRRAMQHGLDADVEFGGRRPEDFERTPSAGAPA